VDLQTFRRIRQRRSLKTDVYGSGSASATRSRTPQDRTVRWRRLRPIPNLAPSSERWLRSGLSWQKPPANRPAMTPGSPLVRFCPEGLRYHRPSRKRILRLASGKDWDAAVRLMLRLTSGCGWMRPVWGDQIMRSTSPPWVWVALVLALLMIGYVVAPPVVIRQAAALWGWG
jgi:hypothetical protein